MSPEAITAAVRAAVAARSELTLAAVRLVDGAGDGLPRLVVERFDDTLWIRGGPERAGDLDAIRAGLPAQPTFWRFGHGAFGGPPGDRGQRETTEAGLRFHIELGENRNPGLFLDGRGPRAWVRAHSADRAMLNLFSYTCAFGVAAAAGGARRTTNVDLAAGALARGRANYALNGLPCDDRSFWKRDALKALRSLRAAGRQFDAVIVDPPPLGHGAAARDPLDYLARICRLARAVLAPGGWLLALCATHGVDPAVLDAAVGLGPATWRAPPAPDFRPLPDGPRLHAAAYASGLAPTSARDAAGPAGST